MSISRDQCSVNERFTAAGFRTVEDNSIHQFDAGDSGSLLVNMELLRAESASDFPIC
jgi:hypothetical protein